jgi:ubiquinone/menaquinone biosynthesis C-methylase UbiE/DNA-binding transcriptional ArsR family regulator
MTVANSPSALLDSLSALNDCVRLRVLRLLSNSELGVGELSDVLQLPQSTVSRHLKLLLETGFVSRRTLGTTGLYRISEGMRDETAELWSIASRNSNALPGINEDDSRLISVLDQRHTDSKSFFKNASGAWESLRNKLYGNQFTSTALLSLLDSTLVVVDIGCGIGNAAAIIAPFVKQVIGVDRESAMLAEARQRPDLPQNIEFVKGDALQLPVKDNASDITMFCLVLHHIEDVASAILEAGRVTKSGGRILIIDMQKHIHDEYRHTMGHSHLGFSKEDMQTIATSAGLTLDRYQKLHPDTDATGPSLFVALLS